MKRKTTAVLLCAVLTVLAVCGAAAEGGSTNSIRDLVVTEEKKPFTFRNGITWAMNQQQVAAIENIPMKQSSSSEWAVLIPESQVQVSRFYADLVYIFRQDALRMITYEFTQDCSTLNYQYLTGALCSLCGDSREGNPVVIKGWMDRIFPNHYIQDQIHGAKEWTAEDGTAIFQYYFTAENYAILYVCPTSDGNGAGYDTNGL